MAPLTLTVHDETTAGDRLHALDVQLERERVTVAELIRARVHQEVRAHNAELTAGGRPFAGLVQPEQTERELNGSRPRRPIDADRQTEVALRAFERGNVLLLVDDRQLERPADEVELRRDSTVTFLKLVPLVGG